MWVICVSIYLLAIKTKARRNSKCLEEPGFEEVAGCSHMPLCDVLEMLFSRASAGGKGDIFEEFQPKKTLQNQFRRPRFQSLSHLQVNRALPRELNWLFTWVRWAGLVPGSSTYNTHCKTALSSAHSAEETDKLTQKILLQPSHTHLLLPPPHTPRVGVSPKLCKLLWTWIRAEGRIYLKVRSFHDNHSRSLGKDKNSIYFRGDWKVTALEHQMVLAFHGAAQRKSFQMKPCLRTADGVCVNLCFPLSITALNQQ